MKKLILGFTLLTLLTGCEQWKKLTGRSDTSSATPAPQVVLIAGQSNAGLLADTGGMNGWVEVTGRHDDFIGTGEAGTSTNDWATSQPMVRCLAKVGNRVPDVILWYQGEADAQQGLSAGFNDRTKVIFDIFRSHWPHAMIIYAQIGNYDPVKWPALEWTEVQNLQAAFVYPNSIMVRTVDLVPGGPTTGGDGIHYSDYIQVGRRFAQGYETLLARSR